MTQSLFACCGFRGCDWSQAARDLNDALLLCRKHGVISHEQKPELVTSYTSGPWHPSELRPNAIDYELAP